MATIQSNLQAVNARIAAACTAAGRDRASVQLVAVSKTWPAAAVEQAAAAGQADFGENYLQEALDKIVALSAAAPPHKLTWHFIGPLQSNKTRPVAERFDWVHSVDREKVAERLNAQRPEGAPALNVCIQVNISGEASKSGVEPADLAPLAREVARMPRLRLRGLMGVPEPTPDTALARRRFASLRGLLEQLNVEGMALDTLSMGMTADLEAAIAEGATLVRVGTAIFGTRQ
jgi:pyridoxal phosphate enzyme (YggS family)